MPFDRTTLIPATATRSKTGKLSYLKLLAIPNLNMASIGSKQLVVMSPAVVV
jgi:hypothetical protein